MHGNGYRTQQNRRSRLHRSKSNHCKSRPWSCNINGADARLHQRLVALLSKCNLPTHRRRHGEDEENGLRTASLRSQRNLGISGYQDELAGGGSLSKQQVEEEGTDFLGALQTLT